MSIFKLLGFSVDREEGGSSAAETETVRKIVDVSLQLRRHAFERADRTGVQVVLEEEHLQRCRGAEATHGNILERCRGARRWNQRAG